MTTSPHKSNAAEMYDAMMAQVRALRNAKTADELHTETVRTKGICQIAAAVTSLARVEVEYAAVHGDDSTVPFLQNNELRSAISHPTPGTTRHRLLG